MTISETVKLCGLQVCWFLAIQPDIGNKPVTAVIYASLCLTHNIQCHLLRHCQHCLIYTTLVNPPYEKDLNCYNMCTLETFD